MVAQMLKGRAPVRMTKEGVASALEFGMLAAAVTVLATGVAMAGNDNTFQQADTFVGNFLSGSGGKTLSGVALISAVANAVLGFNWKFFASAVAVGLGCGIGPGVMDTFFTGVF